VAWFEQRNKIFEVSQKGTEHKYSAIIKKVSGDRLKPYRTINDIEYILSKNLANSIDEALTINDIYVTLSMCNSIINSDIDRKIKDYIEKQK
jgi:hypothetical protein